PQRRAGRVVQLRAHRGGADVERQHPRGAGGGRGGGSVHRRAIYPAMGDGPRADASPSKHLTKIVQWNTIGAVFRRSRPDHPVTRKWRTKMQGTAGSVLEQADVLTPGEL